MNLQEFQKEFLLLKERISFLERILLRNPRTFRVKASANQEQIMEKAVQFCAVWFGVKPAQIIGTSRVQRYVWPRWVAMHLARKYTNLGVSDLGKLFKRDHASISHACRELANAMEINEGRRLQVQDIEKEFAALVQPPTESTNATGN